MRILFANKFFWPSGGSERVMFQERRCVLDAGGEVADFSMRDPRNLPSPTADHFVSHVDYNATGGPLRSLRTALSFIHNTEAMRKARDLAEAFRPDIVHLHNIYHQLTPSIIRPFKRAGSKVVLTLHDYKLACPAYLMLDKNGRICDICAGNRFHRAAATRCQGSLARSLLLSAEAIWHAWRGSYDLVDAFLAPSRYMGNAVAGRIGPERLKIIPNGVDTGYFAPTWEDRGYALYLGRLSREKGLDTLLDAQAGMTDPPPLAVAGGGPLAERVAASPGVDALGVLEGDALRRALAGAAFVAVPSRWRENCPMSVLEAMAMGKPVVASRLGGLPELVEHGVTGLLFEPGDTEGLARCMARLSGDATLRRTMGEAARQRAENKFSLARHCRELLNIYHGLLAA